MSKEEIACHDCGSLEGLSYVLDPYALEIEKSHEWLWLCAACYEEHEAGV